MVEEALRGREMVLLRPSAWCQQPSVSVGSEWAGRRCPSAAKILWNSG